MLPLVLNLLLRQSAALAAYARSLHVSGALLVTAAALVPFAPLGGFLGGLHRSARDHMAAPAGAAVVKPGIAGAVGASVAAGQESLAHCAAVIPSLTAPVETAILLSFEPAPKPVRRFVAQGLERGPPVLP